MTQYTAKTTTYQLNKITYFNGNNFTKLNYRLIIIREKVVGGKDTYSCSYLPNSIEVVDFILF